MRTRLPSQRKMSKSLGNIITIKYLLSKFDSEVFRLFVLSTHYRRPVDFNEKTLDQLKLSLERIYSTIDKLETQIQSAVEVGELSEKEKKIDEQVSRLKQRFLDAMDNDFNTAKALANFFKITRIGNKVATGSASKQLLVKILDTITELGKIFGLLKVKRKKRKLSEEARRLIEERDRARKNRDWKKADEIREKLRRMGILLRDYPGGTEWVEEET
jgi:cysteinyl-tRNA synthetase